MRLQGIHDLEGRGQAETVGEPAADVRDVRPAAQRVARQALAIVFGAVEGERQPDVLGHPLHHLAARRLGLGRFRGRDGAREGLRRVRGELEGHADLLGEGLGADIEIARDHRPLLAEQTEHRALAPDIHDHEQLARLHARELQGAVEDGERLDVEHLEVHGGLLELLRSLVDQAARHAHGQDLVGAVILGLPEDLGVQHGFVGRQQSELAVLHLEGGNDARGRERRQRYLPDDDLGSAHGGDDGLAVRARVGHGEVDRLIDLLSLRLCRHRSAAETGDGDVGASTFERQRLDRTGSDVQSDHPPSSQEIPEHNPPSRKPARSP